MKKKDIRIVYKKRRSVLTEEQRKNLDQRIYKRFQQLSLPRIQYLHHYLPVTDQHEVVVHYILQTLKENNPAMKQVVPVMAGVEMQIVLYEEGMKTRKNQWGIDEPIDHILADIHLIDCVLVPLLAFDLKGNRVGYGKGCYDRFLANCNREVIKIGLSYFEPVDEITDTDKFDIPLNYCITPGRIYEFC
jgi:5-formyltetrahydrofolate cyclo-ligase